MIFTEFDIRPWLVVPADMEFFEEEAEFAADQLNAMLHQANHEFSLLDDWSAVDVGLFMDEMSALWIREPGLVEAEQSELEDYVKHLIARVNEERNSEQENEGLME